MELIKFEVSGRFAHFLRAEGGVSCPSYPVPPRTAIIGLMGAVMGLQKDQPQQMLESAHIALAGRLAPTHWHTVKLRKDPPNELPWQIVRKSSPKKADKDNTKPEKATLLSQEWLLMPSYRVWASLPNPFHDELAERLEQRRWHFTPCLGLSEMLADITYRGRLSAVALPEAVHHVGTVARQSCGKLWMDEIFDKKLVVHCLSMPRAVNQNRIFTHEAYCLERDSRPIPMATSQAWKAKEDVIVFL